MIPSIVVPLPIVIRHHANSSAIVCRVRMPDKSSAAGRICRMASELSSQTSVLMAHSGNNLLTNEQMGQRGSNLPISVLMELAPSAMPFNREHLNSVPPQRKRMHSRGSTRAGNKSIGAKPVSRQRAARMVARNRLPIAVGIAPRSIAQVAVGVLRSTAAEVAAAEVAEQVETDNSWFRNLRSSDVYSYPIQGPSC